MELMPLHAKDIAKWIEAKKRFALCRYGDGEFQCIEKEEGENCDGVSYTRELAIALTASLLNPRIIHCVGVKAHNHWAEDWVWKNVPAFAWYTAEDIIEDSMTGYLWSMRAALFRSHLLYVGPERLRHMTQDGLGAADFIPIPLTTAFDDRKSIIFEIHKECIDKKYGVIGFSAGPAAKVLIDKLETKLPNTTLIDFGSLWDVYAGVPTRSGQKRLTKEEVDALAWTNFHWKRPDDFAPMPYPSIHDLLGIPGLIKEEEAIFLYEMALRAEPGMIVELGTFKGRTAALLARAARETHSRVVSIDDYSYPHHPTIGEPPMQLAKYGLEADFRVGDTRHVPKDVLEVSMLFVDSEHTEAQLNVELTMWLPLVRKNGIIVFHDYGKKTQTDVTKVVDVKMKGYKKLGQQRSMIAFRREN